LPIADCRLPIDGMSIVEWLIDGLSVVDSDCRLLIDDSRTRDPQSVIINRVHIRQFESKISN